MKNRMATLAASCLGMFASELWAETDGLQLALAQVNPTKPALYLANHFDQVAFDGWLGGASQQTATRYSFELGVSYELSGDRGGIFLRTHTPYFFNEPIYVNHDEYVTVGNRFGDTNFDVYWGKTDAEGLILGAGIRGTTPTATNVNLGEKLWAMGPEVILGREWDEGLLGAKLSHQWDVAGEGQGKIDLTELAYFYAIELSDTLQITAEPMVSYDHSADSGERLTLPAGIGVAKVARWVGLPWRFQLQYWNYLESPDIFAPKHQIRLSMTPVINAPWNRKH